MKTLPLAIATCITLSITCTHSFANDPVFPWDILEVSTKKHLQNPIPGYVNENHVDPGLWDALSPYFLPVSFPEKAAYDKIFRKRRVLKSVKDMHKAGFLVFTNPKNKIIVAKHYKTPGLLVKVYLDESTALDWYWWKKRIDGANLIRHTIEKYGYQSIMKVPNKWIYPLPGKYPPQMIEGIPPKNFVLVVEDVHPLPPKDNWKAFKKKITKEHLKALYRLINECGLLDSVYADNIPFCEDGKIAFLDTEHSQSPPPYPLSNIGQYLNKEMLAIWEQLLIGNSVD